ncbi:hypothetical protein C358_02103, partial [Cryptococcus neoformans MW-RSA852]
MKTYDLAQYSYSWNDPEVITISSYDNQLIGTFPLSFIKRGGLNIWAFVSDIVHQLVGTAGGGVIMANDGNPVILQEAPYAGHFVFVPHTSISFARGPEFFRKNIAANPDGSQSTRSDSKRSTPRQVRKNWRRSGVDTCCRTSPTYLRLALDSIILPFWFRIPFIPGPSSHQAPSEHLKSSFDDLTLYNSHLKNKDRPYPLSHIPFDLSEPYQASEYLAIRPYDEACKVNYLGEDWVDMYKGGEIIDEQDFDDTYVRRYLDRFIQDNSNGKRTAFSHQANLKTVFYFGKDKEWAKLDLVDEYRRRTGKVLGVPSQSQDTLKSKNDGVTTPDASLIGYVNDPSSPSGRKRMLYA